MPDHSAGPTLYDNETRYGWISILLHWSTTVIIIALWIIGKSILSAPAEQIDVQRALHVSIAGSAWLLILVRIVWRVRSRHPQVRGQTNRIHRIAKATHYTMLVVVLLMLISGPLLVWASGHPITLFNQVRIPGPFDESSALRSFAWLIHQNMANVLLLLVLLHIGGALKHLMFHNDDTIVRMIWPGKTSTVETKE